jgi:hypothetical protein
MNSDDMILDLIFNPGLQGAGLQPPPQPQLPEASLAPLEPALLARVRDLEARAILEAEAVQKRLAEASKAAVAAADSSEPAAAASSSAAAAVATSGAPGDAYATALSLLDEVLTLAPSYASGHNNRAQVLQLARRPLTEALAAAELAVKFAEARAERAVLAQAYTQRGLIRRGMAAMSASSDSAAAGASAEPSAEIEALALADLQRGGALGNKVGRAESVRLNPYAALCNQYLQKALDNHWSGLADKKATSNADANADAAKGDGAASCASKGAGDCQPKP